MTPKSIESSAKRSDPSAKTFRPICQKFCPFWPLNFHIHQKKTKKNNRATYLARETGSHFNLPWSFLIIFLGLLNRMGTYPKVQMGKRRRYGWMHEGWKIISISFCISYDEVGARKKTSSTNNIQFFWKSYFTQMVELNKTKLSFHFEYIIIISHVFIEILCENCTFPFPNDWKNRPAQ